MLEFKRAKVERIYKLEDGLEEIELDIDHAIKKAINYPKITGSLKEGDMVLANTTACTLNLGTGGYHFIMGNTRASSQGLTGAGHGMKLKYAPNQINVLFAEEEACPLHEQFHQDLVLRGKLIFICELHSMLVPICAHLKFCLDEAKKIACIITDHGALPIWISKNIKILKAKGLLDSVICIGNAFGGDYECVNIYTALQLAANILDVDAIIITMGPGIMGTATPFGFSGLELGFYLDFCYSQDANVLYAPRISYQDRRHRHYGISHHFINTFKGMIQNPVPIVLPYLNRKKTRHILSQLRKSDLLHKHPLAIVDGKEIKSSLSKYQLNPTTMGRGIEDDPEFFYALGAIVKYSLSQL